MKVSKGVFIAGILFSQALFVLYGLFVVFWTLNEWLANRALNALFGAGMGGLIFFLAWIKGRAWARGYWARHFSG